MILKAAAALCSVCMTCVPVGSCVVGAVRSGSGALRQQGGLVGEETGV